MELEELQLAWRERERKLEARIQWNERLLQTTMLDKAETSMSRLSRSIWIELLCNLVLAVALGSFVVNHIAEPRFWLPAGALDLGAITLIVAAIRQLAAISGIDYGQPIVAIQRQLETLRVERIHTFKWTVLLSPLVWTPLFIVAMRGLLSVDVYQWFGIPWIVANLLFGIVAIPIGIWLCRCFADRMERSPLLRSIAQDIGGQSLAKASGFLNALSQFEAE